MLEEMDLMWMLPEAGAEEWIREVSNRNPLLV